MALHGNMNVFHKNPGLSLSGQSLFGNRPQSNKNGSQRNVFSGEYNGGFDQKSGTPLGYTPPYSYTIALRSGGIASFRYVAGAGDVTDADIAGGVNLTADLSGSGDITNAAGALVVSAIATLVGAGTVTGSLIGIATATADLVGQGNVTAALAAIASLTASIEGSGTAAGVINAKGFMTADITSAGDALTAGAVAAAVWESIATAFNTPGTMGNKLNSAASAGDPWSTALPGSYAPGEAGYIIGTNLDAAVSSLSTSAQAILILKILRNKIKTDDVTGLMTVYDDDGTTPLFTAPIFQDASGTVPYAGNGINLKDRLE